MMWFFILLGIAIVVVFVILGYKAAVKAARDDDDNIETKKGRRQ